MKCKICDKRIDGKSQKTFCSKQCQHIGFRGKNNPAFRGAKKKSKCFECGQPFEYFKSASIGKYCSNECCLKSKEWREKNSLAKTGVARSEASKLRQSKSTRGVPKPSGFAEATSRRMKSHYDTIGRKTPELKSIRLSEENKLWKFSVLKRDGFRCVKCGSNKKIQADHIISLGMIVLEKKMNPNIDLFDLDNGRTLCYECHRKTKTYAVHTLKTAEGILYNTIKKIHEQEGGTKETFDEYYDEKMEKIIEQIKSKLE